MSEQEKKSGGSIIKEGSSLVVVEQSTASRHKPYRPTDEQPELHQKRSRAPAVPSVAEELKGAAKNVDSKERRECEQAIASEKHKQNVAKKLSSSTKRRDPSPEAITLAPIEVELKQERVSVPPQPVSPAVVVPSETKQSDLKSAEEKKEQLKHDDEDSITDEVADLRTTGMAKKTSEWDDNETDENKESPAEKASTGSIDDLNESNEDPKAEVLLEDENNSTPIVEDEEGIPFMETPSQSNSEMGEINQAPQEDEVFDTQDLHIYEEPVVVSEEDGGNREENINFLSMSDEGEIHQLNQKIMSSPNMCNTTKKKGISWDDSEYQEKIPLQDMTVRSQPWMSVERKASVGPCFRSGMPFSGPSGITLCLPRKPMKTVTDSLRTMPSGISITVSKKNLSERPKSRVHVQQQNAKPRDKVMERSTKRVEESYIKFIGLLRDKIENVRGKIKNVINL